MLPNLPQAQRPRALNNLSRRLAREPKAVSAIRGGSEAEVATWAIGDIHGCWLTLQRLLERIGWRPGGDRLWLVGDLVNRGPSSLEVLRWAYQHRRHLVAVLGNHDLHLLARAAGLRSRPDDTAALTW